MWARRGEGQEFARLERKEKYENVHDRNPRCAGYNRLGAGIQSADRSAKTCARNAHAAADVATAAR